MCLLTAKSEILVYDLQKSAVLNYLVSHHGSVAARHPGAENRVRRKEPCQLLLARDGQPRHPLEAPGRQVGPQSLRLQPHLQRVASADQRCEGRSERGRLPRHRLPGLRHPRRALRGRQPRPDHRGQTWVGRSHRDPLFLPDRDFAHLLLAQPVLPLHVLLLRLLPGRLEPVFPGRNQPDRPPVRPECDQQTRRPSQNQRRPAENERRL